MSRQDRADYIKSRPALAAYLNPDRVLWSYHVAVNSWVETGRCCFAHIQAELQLP